MFSSQRPAFGSSTFGSGFGQSNTSNTFGSSTFGKPAFGAPTTSSNNLFGSTTNTGSSLFGTSQPSSGGLFGSSNQTNAFGSSSTFGTSTSGGGLFGSNSQTNTGGMFGNSGSAFNTNQNRPFSFGSTSTATGTSSGGLFGSNTNTSGGSMFGSSMTSSMTNQTGTTVKYNPVTSSDTMTRGGVSTNIQTKLEVITAMKEYESKALEELRVEDYLAGRKGASTQNTGFGFGSTFGSTNQTSGSSSLFGQTSSAPTNTLFGKTQENKSLFGSNTGTSFNFNQPSSAPAGFGMSTTTTQAGSTFGSTGFNFGQTSSQSGGLFGNNKMSFGSNTATSTGGGLFSTNKPAFGATNTSTSTGLFGNKPAAGGGFGGFGTSTASPFGTTNLNTSTGGGGLFNSNQNKTGFGFGNTNTGGFGGTSNFNSGNSLFTAGSKPFALNTSSAFGQPATGLNFNQNTSGGILGGSGGFGAPLTSNTGGFNTFNSFNTGGGFGANTMQQPNQSVNVVTNNNINNLIKALTHNPFGNSSLMKNATAPTGKANELLDSISSDRTEASKVDHSKKPNYVLPSSLALKPKAVGLGRGNSNHVDPAINMLFAGLDDSIDASPDDPLKPRFYPRVKKLQLKVFKNNSTTNESEKSSLTPSHEATPTPDIIKGRQNIKALNIARKTPLNDTMSEYNLPKPISLQEVDVQDKENNISIALLDSTGFESPDELNTSTSVYPAGIKLTRSGYYTLPSIDDLKEMVNEDGKCLVENFTIGRYDYGNICFLGITDIANLDLDSIVHIVRKEVEVYPEGVEKPDVGEGLNKPALVTLDCVWPVDKSTREIIKEEDRLESMRWTDFLEKNCLKMNASFVEYRPETGSWVFKVQHFSKYGLTEESEVQQPLKKQPVPTSQPPVAQSTSPNSVTSPIMVPRKSSTAGPPTVGLVSPPKASEDLVYTPPSTKVYLDGSAYIPMEKELNNEIAKEPGTMLQAKVYLDGSTIMPMEEELISEIAKEPDESAAVGMLSPSAERLAVSTFLSHKAAQIKKSHLFDDCDEGDPIISKGEKRSFIPISESTFLGDEIGTQNKSTTKKLLLGHMSETTELNETVHKPSTQILVRPKPITREQEEIKTVNRRDPRTEYPLLPSQKIKDTPMYNPKHLQLKIPYDSCLSSTLTNCISDSSAFMSRSFRVGWGPGLTLIHVGRPMGTQAMRQSPAKKKQSAKSFLFGGNQSHVNVGTDPSASEKYSVSIEKLSLAEDVGKNFVKGHTTMHPLLKACLENVLTHRVRSSYEQQDYFEQFMQPRGIDLLHHLAATSFEVESDDLQSKFATIFSLCVALWGKLEFSSIEHGNNIYEEAQCRKEALSQWIVKVSEPSVTLEVENALQSENSESYLHAIFSHMTTRQISEACNLSQNKGDHRLSLLLSQISFGGEEPRQIIKHQLATWCDSGSDRFIADPRLLLYCLAAGIPTHHASDKYINTCHALDWKRALGLHMWYFTPATATVGEGLELYEKAAGLLQNDETYCEEPKPNFAAECPDDIKINYDICYHLIKLFVDPTHQLETLLETSSTSPDAMDVAASWLIWCILQSLGYNKLSDAKATSLHLSFSSLLEAQGHWEWAVFILQFINEPYCRQRELNSLLERQLLLDSEEDSSSYQEKEDFLVSKLSIPLRAIYRSKSFRARYFNSTDEQTWYLLKDQQFDKAHRLVLDVIAPNAIINEDHSFLKVFLNELQAYQEEIMDWANGGAVYSDYINLIEQIDYLKASEKLSGREIEQLRPKLLTLCTKLNNIKCYTAVLRVTISEMSRVVISILRAILGSDPDAPRVLACQITSLPLTNECALEELNLITHQYLLGVE